MEVNDLVGREITVTFCVIRESLVRDDRYYLECRDLDVCVYLDGDQIRALMPKPDPLGRDARGVTAGMRKWLKDNPTLKGRNNRYERR